MKLQLLPIVAAALILWAGTQNASATPKQVSLCFSWTSPAPEISDEEGYNLQSACLGGNATLLFTGIRLRYNATSTVDAEGGGVEYEYYADQVKVGYNDAAPTLSYWSNSSQHRNLTRVEYLIVQPEHGGGKCHCLEVIFSECKHTASKEKRAK